MRVVARQHVNEVATDALLLQRARQQISFLRRRLREIEIAAPKKTPLLAMKPSYPPPEPSRVKAPATRRTAQGSVSNNFDVVPAVGNGSIYRAWSDAVLVASDGHQTDEASLNSAAQRRLLSARERHNTRASSEDSQERMESRRRNAAVVESSSRRQHLIDPARPDVNKSAKQKVKAGNARRNQNLAMGTAPTTAGGTRRASNEVAAATRADSKEWTSLPLVLSEANLPRRGKRAVAGDQGERGIATAALIERFSCREGELLREVETWKTKCEELEGTLTDDGGGGDACGGVGAVVQSGEHARNDDEAGFKTTPSDASFLSASLPLLPAQFCSHVENTFLAKGADRDDSAYKEPVSTIVNSTVRRFSANRQHTDQHEAASRNKDREDTPCSGNGDISWVRVLFDFVPEQEGDLELRRGESIEVGPAREETVYRVE